MLESEKVQIDGLKHKLAEYQKNHRRTGRLWHGLRHADHTGDQLRRHYPIPLSRLRSPGWRGGGANLG